MIRGRTPPPPLPRGAQANDQLDQSGRRQQSAGDTAQVRRASWQAQQASRRRRLLQDDEANRLLANEDDSTSELEDWRQNAQMLSERDEMLLLADQSRDVLDVAPVNRRQLQQQQLHLHLPPNAQNRRRTPGTPTTETSSRQSPESNSKSQAKRTSITMSKRKSHSEGKDQENQKPRGRLQRSAKKSTGGVFEALLDNDDDDDDDDDDDEDDQDQQRQQADELDDDSSISFAQSGCHSILSAWRLKAAKRRARSAADRASQQVAQQRSRPRSVLSQSSSIGRKSGVSTTYTTASRAGPLAQNRIPLGPKSAQHFVTNSRRRRRANELIMNTIEAKRRAISLNRQNILSASSLFGSESYLGLGGGATSPPPLPLQGEYGQRLLRTPSPGARRAAFLRSPSPYDDAGSSAAVAELTRRSALSDLGGRQSPSEAQRAKLLHQLINRKSPSRNGKQANQSTGHRQQPPPLAKLDQNSSDLCSSNDSSSGAESQDESSSSSGSQFTQLVTSELTPSRILLGDNDQDNRDVREEFRQRRPAFDQAKQTTTQQRAQFTANQARAVPTAKTNAERQAKRKQQQQLAAEVIAIKSVNDDLKQQVSITTSEDDDKLGKLRRGALKRDSIRRLRLSKQQQAGDGSSSSNEYNSEQQQRHEMTRLRPGSSRLASTSQQRDQQQHAASLRPLSKARKLDIESNPFLNRHHFRTLSARSSESRSSNHVREPNSSSRIPTEQVAGSHNRSSQSDLDQQRPQRPARRSPVQQVGRRSETISPPPVPPKNHRPVSMEENKLQMPHIDLENVRQAERIIRDLQQAGKSQQSERVQTNTTTSLADQPPPTAPRRRNSREAKEAASKQHDDSSATQDEVGENERNVFKTTTRLVREGARSSDNLKSDLRGNRDHLQLVERWRHEHQPPTRLQDGSIFSEEKFLSERLEVRKSQELLNRSISPPAEFSDQKSSQQSRNTRSPSRQQQQQSEPTATRNSSASERRVERRPLDEPKVGPNASSSSIEQLAARGRHQVGTTVQRPAALPRVRSGKNETAFATQATKTSPKSFGPVSVVLPKFERTANDEFKKRVDQLRQMARANLEASEARQAQEAAARRRDELIRPLSTNWEGPATRQRQQPAATDSVLGTKMTNLDEMLLADRYQRPLTSSALRSAGQQQQPDAKLVGTWRRSNSSLASIGRPSQPPGSVERELASNLFIRRPQDEPSASRQKLLTSSGSVLSQSAVSIGDSQAFGEAQAGQSNELEAPMRVIVRERRAPELDFAQVEQRPVTQHARQVEQIASKQQPHQQQRLELRPRSGPSPTPSPASSSQQPVGSSVVRTLKPGPELVRPTAATSVGQAPATGSSTRISSSRSTTRTTQPTTTTSHRASPLSPEFGRAAASSNDDSAIASSISSPSSMSFAMNSAGGIPATSGPHSGPSFQRTSSAPRPISFEQPSTQFSPLTASKVDSPTLNSPQTIQSILRRQQFHGASGQLQAGPQAQQISAPPPMHFGQAQTFPMQTQPSSSYGDTQQQSQAGAQLTGLAPQPISGEQQTSPAAAAATTTKRVHFNDRTSVRSFESISSTNSNTTAIQQHQQSDLDEFDIRQQVGSPDSMGSGSTSRLSCESPAFGARPSDRLGGAAIYAIRGDPDLELAGGSQLGLQSRQQFQSTPNEQHRAQAYFAGQHQQRQLHSPASVQYVGQPPAHQPVKQVQLMPGPSVQQALRSPQRQQQQHQIPVPGAIRMTAPPAISTGQPPASYQQHVMLARQQQQQQFAPVSNVAVARAGQMNLVSGDIGLDEDDPDYALRLRQAATRRAFNYIQTPSQQQQHLLQSGQANPLGQTSAQVSNQSASGAEIDKSKRVQSVDLANFQTEV